MERWLEDDILRTDGIEQSLLHRAHVDTNELLVEGDRQRTLPTEFRHLAPLVLLDGLLYRVDIVLGKCLQSAHRIFWRETAVGIHTQFHLFLIIYLTDALDEVEFLEEVDGTNLQFDTMETSLQLLFQASQHFLVSAHPHQSIDGDTLLATSKRRVVERGEILSPSRHGNGALPRSIAMGSQQMLASSRLEEGSESRLQSEGDARVRPNHIVRDASHLLHHLAYLSERHLILWLGITTEVGQCGALPHSLHTGSLIRGEMQVIAMSSGIDSARRTSRLLKVERTLRNANLIHFYFLFIS